MAHVMNHGGKKEEEEYKGWMLLPLLREPSQL